MPSNTRDANSNFLEKSILLLCILLWIPIGLIVWIPLLFFELLFYTYKVMLTALGNNEIGHTLAPEIVNFYYRGYLLIIRRIFGVQAKPSFVSSKQITKSLILNRFVIFWVAVIFIFILWSNPQVIKKGIEFIPDKFFNQQQLSQDSNSAPTEDSTPIELKKNGKK